MNTRIALRLMVLLVAARERIKDHNRRGAALAVDQAIDSLKQELQRLERKNKLSQPG